MFAVIQDEYPQALASGLEELYHNQQARGAQHCTSAQDAAGSFLSDLAVLHR